MIYKSYFKIVSELIQYEDLSLVFMHLIIEH